LRISFYHTGLLVFFIGYPDQHFPEFEPDEGVANNLEFGVFWLLNIRSDESDTSFAYVKIRCYYLALAHKTVVFVHHDGGVGADSCKSNKNLL